MAAYGDALERCSTELAPWYVVPADRKWFRNWPSTDRQRWSVLGSSTNTGISRSVLRW